MPKISALIHTLNDAQRLSRAIESLRSCDEVLVVDHGSEDNTETIARDRGAKVKAAIPGVEDGTYAVDATYDWILCVQPSVRPPRPSISAIEPNVCDGTAK